MAHRWMKKGKRTFLDPRYSQRSIGEQAMADIIIRAWEHDPSKRISVFEIVRLLKVAIEQQDEAEARQKLDVAKR